MSTSLRNYYYIFVLLAIFLHPFISGAQLYTFENFNHRDGLNMASVRVTTQTNDGYLWIGTMGSELIRYGGTTFDEIKFSNSDNNHHISSFWQSDDDILFSSLYKGYFKYNRSKDTIVKFNTKNLSIGEAIGIAQIKDSYYFIGTRGIILKNGDDSRIIYNHPSNATSLSISQIIEAENTLFVLTNNGGFVIHDEEITSLKKWVGFSVGSIERFKFGYFDDGTINLLHERGDRWLHLSVDENGGMMTFKDSKTPPVLRDDESIVSFSHNLQQQSGAFVTESGKIYKQVGRRMTRIVHNFTESIEDPAHIYTDNFGDYWVSSYQKGLYKISLEPFTKVDLHPIYSLPDIGYPYKTKYDNIIISTFSGETYVGDILDASQFQKFDFIIKGISELDDKYYAATNTGVRVYHPESHSEFEVVYFNNQNITSIIGYDSLLWVGIAGDGLHQINILTGRTKKLNPKDIALAQYFYTAQLSRNKKYILFGSNMGVYRFDLAKRKFSRIEEAIPLGSYFGVSIKDKYGTCWFTGEKGVIGVTRKDEVVVLDKESYFNSYLFYTLNSDAYGNLILGTNKGLTFLKVSANGKVLSVRHFNDKTGFSGYETNMRSQFQTNEDIFIGTVEGLFSINTFYLEENKQILAPIVTRQFISELEEFDNTNSLIFKFHVNHPKAGNVQYAYRIKGISSKWDVLTESNIVRLHGLNNGEYILEVKASYDGKDYSATTEFPFVVDLPIWKSNWFIILLLVVVIVINVILLRFYDRKDRDRLMTTKDIEVHLKLTPFLLLFAAIAAPAAQILAPILVPDLQLKLGQALIMCFVLLTLFFLSLNARNTGKTHLFNPYLKIGFIIVLANYYWEVYSSQLHPFYIIGVVLISTLAPYVLNTIKMTVVFAVLLLATSICFVSILDATVYPKTYFIIAVFVMSCLMIVSSYLRFDSLEKLIFISSIVNKGNIPAIAFNNSGIVTYASENIENFADITHDKIVGSNISILNQFVPYGEKYKETDVTRDFVDGGKYIVPMEHSSGQVFWIEWDFKQFSDDIRVIFGKDVSDKLELENTYELLVQNAEDFIYRCDVNGNFIFLNDISYDKLGYNKEDLIGMNSLEIVPDEYKEEIELHYRKHFLENRSSSYKEFPIRKKNNEIIWIGQYVTTLYATGSTTYVNGYIALARDITQIRMQQELIKEQRDSITASINYARRIQYNLLPQEQEFKQNFDEHFVISIAKDIVSGDFFWMGTVDNKRILALADCTGHGVPGSFMTLLGINLLNTTVLENNIITPSIILNELDKKLIEYLPKGDGENAVNDAMEVTICVFDENTSQMSYACAGSRFLVYENENFTMFKGDNKHIGDIDPNFGGYHDHNAEFSSDYNLFLFTDGFQDQFGGPKDKKYSFRRMLELFESNIYLSLNEQKKMIEKDFEKWVGKNQQTDDVTIISIKQNVEKTK